MVNFISYIFQTFNKGTKYDVLSDAYDFISESLAEFEVSYGVLESEKEEISQKYEFLKTQYKDLLEEGKLDILDLKSWYEAKYESKVWLYNFDGEGRKDAKLALVVTSNGEEILKDLADELITRYEPVNPSDVVASVMKYFSQGKNWEYVYDKDQFDLLEFWELAENSAKTRKGDCDDLAILMHNTVYFMFEQLGMSEHYWRLKLAAGRLVGYGGHCYNIWLGDSGEWYVVESTFDLSGSFKRTWLETPIKNNNLYYDFWGFARKDKSWLGLRSSLEPYKKRS